MTAPASKELGETQDPTQLVPGDVSVVDQHVRVLGAQSARLEATATTVAAIRTPSWSGDAADGFESSLSGVAKEWTGLSDVLGQMKGALSTYAGALAAAQGKAADAIDKWNQGEQATSAAQAAYRTATAQYEADQAKPDADPLAPAPVWSDPGASLRAEAQTILSEARKSLDEAGDAASQTIGNLPGVRTTDESGAGSSFGAGDDLLKIDLTMKEKGSDPKFHQSEDEDDGKSLKDKTKVTIAGVKGSADLFAAGGKVEDKHGALDTSAEGKVSAGLEGSANATWGKDGFGAEADAFAGVHAHGEADADLAGGLVDGKAQGDAMAGAMGHGEVAAGPDGAHASGEVFAGAKASGSLDGSVAGVGGGVDGEAWAGVGASGDADLSYHDGKFTIGAHGGVGLGVGGKVGFHLTIDVPEVTHSLGDAADAVGSFVEHPHL